MNEEKILDALKFIKDIFDSNICLNCPLSNRYKCILTENCPNEWELNDKLPEKWNAFRLEDME